MANYKRAYEILEEYFDYIPEEDKRITLKVSASALKTINRIGIFAAIKDAKSKGFLK